MVDNRVNKVIRQSLSDVLKRHGFQRTGALYVRRFGDMLHMIEAQHSRWNDTTRKSFTLNCGVYVPGVTSTFWNTPEPKKPKLTDCCISIRVGMLREPRCDIWWEVSHDDSLEKDAQIQADIVSIITESVLPFLSRFQNESEITQVLTEESSSADGFIEPRASATRLAYAALLWRRLGEVSKCSSCINESKQRSKKTPLEAVINAFASRFNCTPP